MAGWQAIPANQFRRQRWANGQGFTTELAAGPEREHWRWRISLAEVVEDGDFSRLPGVHRQLAPLDGRLELHEADDHAKTIQRLQVIRFDGGSPIHCRLPDGPGRDLNLMLREGADGELIVRPLAGSMVLPRAGGARWFLLVLAGHAVAEADGDHLKLDVGEAAWLLPGGSGSAHLEGSGEIALVRLAVDQD